MAKHILLLNGPNLNLLGHREPSIYGTTTLLALETSLKIHCQTLSPPVHLTTYQSNHEGALIDMIHRCKYPDLVSEGGEGGKGGIAHRDNPSQNPVSNPDIINPESQTEKAHKDNPTQNPAPKTGVDRGEMEMENAKAHKDNPAQNPPPTPPTTPPPITHILINPGALTHTSIALRDALSAVALPYIEIHITNIHAREGFRHRSFLAEGAEAVVCGLGVGGYRVGVDYFVGGGGI